MHKNSLVFEPYYFDEVISTIAANRELNDVSIRKSWQLARVTLSSKSLSSMPVEALLKSLREKEPTQSLNWIFFADGENLVIQTGVVRQVSRAANGFYLKSFFSVIWGAIELLRKIDPKLVVKFDQPDSIHRAIIKLDNAANFDLGENENCAKRSLHTNEFVEKIDFLLEEFGDLKWQRLGVKSFDFPIESFNIKVLEILITKFIQESPGIELSRNTFVDEYNQKHMNLSLMLIVGYIEREELNIEWDELESYLEDRRNRLRMLLIEE